MAGGVITAAFIQGAFTAGGGALVIIAAIIQANAMKQQTKDQLRAESRKFKEETAVFALLSLNDARIFIENAKERHRAIIGLRNFIFDKHKLPDYVNERYVKKHIACQTWIIRREDFRYIFAIRHQIEDALAHGAELRDYINNNVKEMQRAILEKRPEVALKHIFDAEQEYPKYIKLLQTSADKLGAAFKKLAPPV